MPDQEAKTVAETFVTQFIARFGAPLLVHTDQGRNFEAKLFKEMCSLLGIKKTRTTAFHPQGNGMVERMNKTIGTMITSFVSENQKTWDEHLAVLMMAYRSSPHESTGMTPNELMLGREISMPIDVMVGLPPDQEPKREPQYVEDLRARLEDAYSLARENLGVSAERRKRYYDLKALSDKFSVGDPVWLINKSRRKGRCPKLQRKWLGPMLIETVVNDVTFKLRIARNDTKVVHYDQVKPYLGSNLPDWMETLREKLLKAASKDK